jgi:two-component system, NtrC family, C4-dicarboxylate transport sensor histidine kinase DctB
LQILEQRQYGSSLRVPLTESQSIEDVLLEPRLQLSKDGYISHYYQTYTDMVGVGWRLFAMAPVSIVSYSAVRSLMFFTLIYILLFLIALSWRRTAYARRELAIINEKLEHIVDDRTIELSQANTQLIEIIEKYKETEITLKQTQGELIQSAKLAMLGEMAASINHELNQPLAAMRIYAENLQAFVKRGDPEAIKRNSKHILELNQMMAKIVGQYKIFARKSTGRVMAVSLRETISESLAILESNVSKSEAKISLKNLEQDLFVLADKVPLEQVVINLVNNALQAVEDCGDQGKIWISAAKEEEKVILVVSDNGPGFTEEQLDKLFTPFFTTKDQGLGMGLTISQRIIESFNGSISAINRIGGGAEFSLSLPRVQIGAE